MREKGNAAFKAGDFGQAVKFYTDGLGEDVDADHLLLCNCAAAQLKLSQYKEALESATRSIKLNTSNSKAHFRQGEALLGMGQQTDALAAFKRAQQCEEKGKGLAAIAQRIQQLEMSTAKQIQSIVFRNWTTRRMTMRLPSMTEGVAVDATPASTVGDI